MKVIYLFLLVFIIAACGKDNVPDLPENIDTSESDLDIQIIPDSDDFMDNDTVPCPDSLSNYDGKCVKTYLAIAQTEGYSKPFSGHFYLAENEDIGNIKEIPMNKLGSSKGADLNISVSSDRVMIVGRDGADNVSVYKFGAERKTSFEEIPAYSDSYLNYHDAAYNYIKNEYLITANQFNYLLKYDESYSEIDISSLYDKDLSNASPSRIAIFKNKAFLSLQCLNNDFASQGGVVGVIDLETYKIQKIVLNEKNPYSKFAYNPAFDADHIYFVASGSWEKRDGALLRISLSTGSVETVISESETVGGILNVDFVDVSLTNNGNIFLIVSDNTEKWMNKIIKIDAAKKVVEDFDSGINAFAATAIDYSPVSDTIYYFRDSGSRTELVAYNVGKKTETIYKLSYGPAALRVFFREIK